MKPHELPVYQQRNKIIEELKNNQVIVVESPTGSGKTTQLPLILYNSGYGKNGKIGVTQPRRIAAVSVCDYIAKQLDVFIPDIVGYKMRFYDMTSPKTDIKIMTDGILLQEMKLDPMLSEYSAIMVDEAHERSLNIDFILGLLKNIIEERPEFKVIISSATINPELFSNYFGGSPIIHIDARIHPVKTFYKPPKTDNEESMLELIQDVVEDHVLSHRPGDILIFLSGEKLIKETIQNLENSRYKKKMFILPLFGRLKKEEQDRVFIPTPPGKTKIVVSTNIAETSITIDNISLVIDSGAAKMNYYNQKTFTSSLVETPISKASCNQRKGRAGRTMPGTCFRLYDKKDFLQRPMYTLEEIKRTDLSEVVLRMAELGIKDFSSFDFISRPAKGGINSAVETLHMLHAIDTQNNLTEIGSMMVLFPLLPRHSRIIIEAIRKYPDVLYETIIAVAFLSTRSPFVLPVGEETEARHAHHSFASEYGDFVSYLTLFRKFRNITDNDDREAYTKKFYLDYQILQEIENIVEQLSEIIAEQQIPMTSGGSIRNYLCAVSAGLIQFVCVKTGGRGVYKTLTAEKIYIHPGSVMFREAPPFIVSGEIVRTSRMFARSVSPLKKEWLKDIYPELYPYLIKGTSPKSKKKTEKDKEFAGKTDQESNTVIIWNKIFKIRNYKGKKKLVLFPLETLKEVYPLYEKNKKGTKQIKGVITYHGFEIHKGDRLPSLMKILPYINTENGIYDDTPKGNFHIPDDINLLSDNLYQLLNLCRLKKGKNLLGFITLETDGTQTYWFKTIKSFHTAIDVTLFSLDQLADYINELHDSSYTKQYNEMYRKISNIFENY